MHAVKITTENAPKGLLPAKIKVAEKPSGIVKGYRNVSGSRAAAVFGMHPWLSRRQLAEFIIGKDAADKPDDSGIMAMGTALEPIIWRMGLARFVAEPVVYDDSTTNPMKITAPDLAMSGTPDGIALRDDKLILIEIKNTSHSKWHEPPPNYYWQVQHYLTITGLPVGEIWALHRGNDLQRYEIPADASHQAELIAAIADLHAELAAGVLPEPETIDDYKSAIAAFGAKADNGKSVDIDDLNLARQAAAIMHEKAKHNERGRDIDKREKALHHAIAEQMGDALSANLAGGIVAKHTKTERKEFTVAAKTVHGFRLTQLKGK